MLATTDLILAQLPAGQALPVLAAAVRCSDPAFVNENLTL